MSGIASILVSFNVVDIVWCCSEINPDVQFEAHNYNITTLDNYQAFVDRIRRVFCFYTLTLDIL